MLVRGITLSLAALFAVTALAESASADQRRRPRHIIIEEGYYGGPPIIRNIPGLRIFFGDYALTEEEYDELYGKGRRVYRDDRGDDDEPVQPRRKSTQKEQQKPAKKTASKPAPNTGSSATQKKPAAKTAAAASGMSCDKAASVVSGYGFSSVTPSSCGGKVYAFNAQRDGKNFAVKLDPKSGELTEVKKLP
jgi:hypothetical protein